MKTVVKILAHPASVLLASALVVRYARRRATRVRFAVAPALAFAGTKLLKHLVDERRPKDDGPADSFPSGHSGALTAFLLSGVAALHRPWLLPAAALGIVVVNRSRVLHRNHWLHDVLAGDTIGIAAATAGELAARASNS